MHILKCDIDVIYHARKSLLFDGSHIWNEKQGGLFDVLMGSYDGAEVCELVGTYLLKVLSKNTTKMILGFIRMDWLFWKTKMEHGLRNMGWILLYSITCKFLIAYMSISI